MKCCLRSSLNNNELKTVETKFVWVALKYNQILIFCGVIYIWSILKIQFIFPSRIKWRMHFVHSSRHFWFVKFWLKLLFVLSRIKIMLAFHKTFPFVAVINNVTFVEGKLNVSFFCSTLFALGLKYIKTKLCLQQNLPWDERSH